MTYLFIFINTQQYGRLMQKKYVEDLLNRFLLIKVTESILQKKLRPAELIKQTLKLNEVAWSSHWVWNRTTKCGYIDHINVKEKDTTLKEASIIKRADLKFEGISMEQLYDVLKKSAAKKIKEAKK